MDCSKSKSYGKRKKEEAGESMSIFIQKYINLYYNKILQKCVADAIQTSRLFLGEGLKGLQCDTISVAHVVHWCLI